MNINYLFIVFLVSCSISKQTDIADRNDLNILNYIRSSNHKKSCYNDKIIGYDKIEIIPTKMEYLVFPKRIKQDKYMTDLDKELNDYAASTSRVSGNMYLNNNITGSKIYEEKNNVNERLNVISKENIKLLNPISFQMNSTRYDQCLKGKLKHQHIGFDRVIKNNFEKLEFKNCTVIDVDSKAIKSEKKFGKILSQSLVVDNTGCYAGKVIRISMRPTIDSINNDSKIRFIPSMNNYISSDLTLFPIDIPLKGITNRKKIIIDQYINKITKINDLSFEKYLDLKGVLSTCMNKYLTKYIDQYGNSISNIMCENRLFPIITVSNRFIAILTYYEK